jgi:hypothetical protein
MAGDSRVFLAVSALVAIRMDPEEVGYSFWAYGLLAFYIAQGVIVILLLRRREQSTYAFRRLVHSADIVWPALISIFATGQANPFFLFFVFVLAAAAYRWGLWETLLRQPLRVYLWLEPGFSAGFLSLGGRPAVASPLAVAASGAYKLRAPTSIHAFDLPWYGTAAGISGRAAKRCVPRRR